MMHCYSNSCEHPLKLGQWVSDVKQLLDADVWGPTSTINPRLIDNLRELALESTTQGKTRDSKFKQMPNMPWWSQLEETVGAYFGRFFAYVVRESLYIMQTLDTEGRMEKFLAFPRGKIADTVRPYKWGFSIGKTPRTRWSMPPTTTSWGNPSMMMCSLVNSSSAVTPCPTSACLNRHLSQRSWSRFSQS